MRFLRACLLVTLLAPLITLSQKTNRFKPGDQLPDLRLSPVFGDSIKTPELKGKKILLTFNRYVSCPLCNFRTHELLERYDTLKENGLIILSVYESKRELLAEYTTREQVPFIMIADPAESLYKQFKIRKSWWRAFRGVFNDFKRKRSGGKKLFRSSYERDGSMKRIGADFLIDGDGVIRVAYYGKFAGDHLPVEEIVKWVLKK